MISQMHTKEKHQWTVVMKSSINVLLVVFFVISAVNITA